MKTYTLKPDDIDRKWYLVDARGQILGRLATEIATILRGKKKPNFSPHMDNGDNVVVINAEKVEVTGRKRDQKLYHHHSGYPGGIKSFTAREKLKRDPTSLIRKAVAGMLPKNKLARQIIKKLKVYPGPEHPHAAQKPVPLAILEQ